MSKITTDELIRDLRNLHKLDFCDDDELRDLLETCEILDHDAGDVLFSKGDAADAFYVVLRGEYKVEGRRPGGKLHEWAAVGPGAVLGEMGILEEDLKRHSDVIAAEPSAVLRITKAHLDAMSKAGTPWAVKLLTHFSQIVVGRLHEVNQAYKELLNETKGKERGRGELEAFRANLLEKWHL